MEQVRGLRVKKIEKQMDELKAALESSTEEFIDQNKMRQIIKE